MSLRLAEPFEGYDAEGVRVIKSSGVGAKLEVDTTIALIDSVIAGLMARYSILDMTVEDPPMEQVIAHIYQSAGSDK